MWHVCRRLVEVCPNIDLWSDLIYRTEDCTRSVHRGKTMDFMLYTTDKQRSLKKVGELRNSGSSRWGAVNAAVRTCGISQAAERSLAVTDPEQTQ